MPIILELFEISKRKKSEDPPIVIKGVPRHALKAQAPPLPTATPHLEHFQVFFFLPFFFFFFAIGLRREALRIFFFVIETKTTSFWPFIYIYIYIFFFSF